MITEKERQREITRYKHLIQDFPDSDRRTHWETLLQSLQEAQ